MDRPSAPDLPDRPGGSLAARLRAAVEFLAAPQAEGLTEAQRAMMLGIARRLFDDLVEALGSPASGDGLWTRWLVDGIPAAASLARPCFTRAEEFRWRQADDGRHVAEPIAAVITEMATDGEPAASPADAGQEGTVARAYLALRIADRRRIDAFGHPRLPIDEIEPELYRALLIDVAAFVLAERGNDAACAADLGDRVRALMAAQMASDGIDSAARAYYAAAREAGALEPAAAAAAARHDWATIIALAAAASGCRYADMALALMTSNTDRIGALLAPLGLSPGQLAPVIESLESMPRRAIDRSPAASGDEIAALLRARAGDIDAGSPHG